MEQTRVSSLGWKYGPQFIARDFKEFIRIWEDLWEKEGCS